MSAKVLWDCNPKKFLNSFKVATLSYELASSTCYFTLTLTCQFRACWIPRTSTCFKMSGTLFAPNAPVHALEWFTLDIRRLTSRIFDALLQDLHKIRIVKRTILLSLQPTKSTLMRRRLSHMLFENCQSLHQLWH